MWNLTAKQNEPFLWHVHYHRENRGDIDVESAQFIVAGNYYDMKVERGRLSISIPANSLPAGRLSYRVRAIADGKECVPMHGSFTVSSVYTEESILSYNSGDIQAWIIRDGAAFCAIGQHFTDLQGSDDYTFGDTPSEALLSYIKMQENIGVCCELR